MELTTRQWNLYNYLKENTDIYLTKEQIVANVDGYIYKDWQNEHNQNAFRQLRDDIRNINSNQTRIQKIIISNKIGYKLATEKEFESWKISQWKLIKRKLYRMGVIDDKALKNNQMRLVEDGSNARLYVESFVDNK